MDKTRLRAAGGFTLIEIMVAVVLLLVVMAGFVPFFMSGLGQASTSRSRSVATNIARERMEEIRQLDYREIVDHAQLAARFGTTKTVRGDTYTIAYDVQTEAYEAGQLKRVTVTVSWTAPPPVSPAIVTSLIHQQFLGPRGGLLEVIPTGEDPLGSPFGLISGELQGGTGPLTTVKYHVAQADWPLVFDKLNEVDMSAKNVYMRLTMAEDAGTVIAFGPADEDYVIDKSYLRYSTHDGKVSDVWFEYPIDASAIPDGYWELRAVMYNQYDQPGNLWRLRLRVENGPPAAPTDFMAHAGADNQSIRLSWVPGPERDRDYFVLERRVNDGDWQTLVSELDPSASSYNDIGDAENQVDPWGSTTDATNYYAYRIWAVDIAGQSGDAAETWEYIPPESTTTTLSTSTTEPTTSTTNHTTTTQLYSVKVVNNTDQKYDYEIKDSSSKVVKSGKVHKNSEVTVSGLPPGQYSITATSNKQPTATASFKLGDQAGLPVLIINTITG